MSKTTSPKAVDLISILRNQGYKVAEAKQRCNAAFIDLGPDAELTDLFKAATKPSALQAVVEAEPEEEVEQAVIPPPKKFKKVEPPKRPRGRKHEEVEDPGDGGFGKVMYLILVMFGVAFLTGLFFLGIARGLPIVLICGVLLYRMGKSNTRRVRS